MESILEFLKGRKIDTVIEEGEQTTIKTKFRGKEEEITVSNDYAKLVLSKDFRDSLNKAVVAPVKDDTNATVHIKSFDGETVIHSISEGDCSKLVGKLTKFGSHFSCNLRKFGEV